MDPILGMIILWAGNWVPDGWVLCDGRLLPVSQYQALFSLLSIIYGGDGSTNFGVPDLRSKVPMGVDARVPGGTVGKTSGAPTYAYNASGVCSGTLTVDNLPAHTHTATFTPGSPGTATTSVNIAIPAVSAAGTTATNIPGPTLSLTGPTTPVAKIYNTGTTDTNLKPFTATGSVALPPYSGTVANATTGNGHALTIPVTVPISVSTVQPSLYLNYIIATSGIYPNRP